MTLATNVSGDSSMSAKEFEIALVPALTKKLRIVFSEFQTNLPTDPSHLPKYIKLMKDVPVILTDSLRFCSLSFRIPILLLRATPPTKVDSEIIRELILFVKEALPTILTDISNIDPLITSLPSDSSPTTPIVSSNDTRMSDSLKGLRDGCEAFLSNGWYFFVNLTPHVAEPHKSSFQTIVLDDPSLPDLVLHSLKLNHKDVRGNTIHAITNIIIEFEWMKEQFMTANLVGRMFETVDFVSLPLLESKTLLDLTSFIANMLLPFGDDEEAHFDQYRLIRVSVFEPAKQFIKFMFRNSDNLVLDEEDKTELEDCLSVIHHHIKNMELRSDEHDADFMSELVKWEVRQMVEMENEENFTIVFYSLLDRTYSWKRDKRERQKRREVRLREDGWDDAFELRVVGIGVDTNQNLQYYARSFRIEQTFNADDLW
ncbi:hypothetical protein BLNAU_11365 [Blattamonas nauphoetae]|uniref:Uncharacterized protein n=1 Tax=Blattamonas nauphoetae TaxID=2049346 RepID=A0ABQ9XPG8_9EUKA|nr:hypothetical protein BLNAU_11365 [Blattamonas nauphoetae]